MPDKNPSQSAGAKIKASNQKSVSKGNSGAKGASSSAKTKPATKSSGGKKK